MWILDFIRHGGSTLEAYPEFRRVVLDNGRYRVHSRKTISMHRMNIGTIASDAAMQVKYLKGRQLGTAEESFLARLSPGEKFLFAGRLVEMVRIRDNVAYVRRAKGQPDAVPRWMGGRMPLSSELSSALRRKLDEASQGRFKEPEVRALRGLVDIQSRWSRVPRDGELLVERIKTKTGFQLFLFPFEGRLVHEGMAALLAYRFSKRRKQTFSMACNDYGLLLQSPSKIHFEEAVAAGLFETENLVGDVLESMNATEMAKRQFRQVARVAGLIQPGFAGRQKSSRQLQASSNLFFDVFQNYDPDNLLLLQSRREVLDEQLEINRLLSALDRIDQSKLVVTDPPKVTPLAFPLLVDKLRERLSSESLADRIRRLQQELEQEASKTK